jgi:hypothetical protein
MKVNRFRDTANKDGGNEVEEIGRMITAVSVRRVARSAHTLPSSHSSNDNTSSNNSLELIANDNLEEEEATGVSTKNVLLSKQSIFFLLSAMLFFAAGLTAGFIVMRNSRESNDSVDGNQSASGTPAAPTSADSPSVTSNEIPKPTVSSTEYPTTRPTSSPTEITADVTREPINPKNISTTLPDGRYDYTANSEYLVGVYYYPWHGDNFHGGRYLREYTVPRQYPSLGEYNDSDPAVIAEHMKMFKKANIGLLVTSWWGPNKTEDLNTKDVIMQHEDIGNLQIAIHYETMGRLGQDTDNIANARTDVEYLCEHYFDHPNYYKIDGRPVMFVYLGRQLYSLGTLEQVLLTMRSTASKCGHDIYLIGDHTFNDSPDSTEEEPYVPFWYFNAVTNYDIYGSAGRPEGHAGKNKVAEYFQHQSKWKQAALMENCHYIPAVSPGYNDRGVRLESEHPALSRKITAEAEEGSLFHYQLKLAKQLVDPEIDNMILVNSFNEWHEDTQIEPVVGETAVWPPIKTQGLDYVGYGDLYLEILGASTVSAYGQGIFDYLYEY